MLLRCPHYTTPLLCCLRLNTLRSNLHRRNLDSTALLPDRVVVCHVQVPSAHVERLDLIPDVDKGQLSVLVHGSPAAKGLKVTSFLSVSNVAQREYVRCSSV